MTVGDIRERDVFGGCPRSSVQGSAFKPIKTRSSPATAEVFDTLAVMLENTLAL